MAGEDIWSPNSQIPRVQTRGLWLGAWALVVVFVLSPWGYHHLKSPYIVTPLTPARCEGLRLLCMMRFVIRSACRRSK